MTANRSSASLVDRLPLVPGAVAGAASFVVGYLLTYVLVEIDGDVDPDQPFEQVGMLFYNAQFASTELTGEAFGQTGSTTENVLRNSSTELPEAVYLAVPVVVLVVAGFVAVKRGSRLAAPAEGAIGGAVLALGALPFAIAGVFVFETSGSFLVVEGSAAPELVPGVLLVGIGYPVVFGGIGGLLAALTE